jgi:hypothetical protein
MRRFYRKGMGAERVAELEQEFRIVKQHVANPLDMADYAELKERLSAIVKEARAIIRTIDVTEPDWCRV